MKKITALMMGVVFLGTGFAFAQQSSVPVSTQAQLVEVGNKHCPVSGREIGAMGPAFKYQYNGKIYNLCCGGCPKTFATNPEKYAKIAEDEANSIAK